MQSGSKPRKKNKQQPDMSADEKSTVPPGGTGGTVPPKGEGEKTDLDVNPDAVKNFEGDISAIVNDDVFIANLRSNFMEKVSDKRGFFRELLSCIFVKPIGVRKLDHASKAGISNREYQAFGADVVAYLKKNHSDRYTKMMGQSPLYKRYGSVWPECSDKITNDILSLGAKIEQQKKVQEMLGRTPAAISGQPKITS